MSAQAINADYNFGYLDEQTKRMIRRALLKAVAIPGYQVPFGSREMPLARGWGTGGIQITAALIGPEDKLKVIDQGADDTTNAVSIRLGNWSRIDESAATTWAPAAMAASRNKPRSARPDKTSCSNPSRSALT